MIHTSNWLYACLIAGVLKKVCGSSQEKAQRYLEASEHFFGNFKKYYQHTSEKLPTTNRISEVYKDPEELVYDMEGTHIVMHSDVRAIIQTYCQRHNINETEFVKHLIRDRPLAFYGNSDITVLRLDDDGNKVEGPSGHYQWRDHQFPEYLSYSEMLISSLLQVSSPTRFINECERQNAGRTQTSDTFIERGQIVALAGPRMEIMDLMDSKYLLVTRDSTMKFEEGTIEKLFQDYYYTNDSKKGDPKKDKLKWLSRDDIDKLDEDDRKARYVKIPDIYFERRGDHDNYGYFDKLVYAKRLRLTMIPYILDANETAKRKDKMAYLFVTGWGLGVWATVSEQLNLFIEEFFKVLSELDNEGLLTNISNVHFSWIPNSVYGRMKKEHHNLTTKIIFENDKADPTALKNFDPNDDSSPIFFFSFAWDGNSYPGNEYWNGKLEDSADPAAACCSTIPEIQNPQINPDFMNRIAIHPSDSSAVAAPPADHDSSEDESEKLTTPAPPIGENMKNVVPADQDSTDEDEFENPTIPAPPIVNSIPTVATSQPVIPNIVQKEPAPKENSAFIMERMKQFQGHDQVASSFHPGKQFAHRTKNVFAANPKQAAALSYPGASIPYGNPAPSPYHSTGFSGGAPLKPAIAQPQTPNQMYNVPKWKNKLQENGAPIKPAIAQPQAPNQMYNVPEWKKKLQEKIRERKAKTNFD